MRRTRSDKSEKRQGRTATGAFKPLVVSPLNLIPKSNSSPGLIHNLKALNRFVKRRPSVKHLNVLELAKSKFLGRDIFVN